MAENGRTAQELNVPLDGKVTHTGKRWFHVKNQGKKNYYPKRPYSSVFPLICGSHTLPSVCHSLRYAQKSIEISIWAFDAALCLYGYHEDLFNVSFYNFSSSVEFTSAFTDKPLLGDLLIQAALRGVKVKLLVYNPLDFYYNMTRWKGSFPVLRLKPVEKYRYAWYNAARENPNIEHRLAGGFTGQGSVLDVIKNYIGVSNLEGEPDYGKIDAVLQTFPSHHQKTVMIDYESPSDAHAYVMGNNFKPVDFDDETHPVPAPEKGGRYPGQPPRQDISSVVRGQALYDVNANFSRVWQEAGGENLERGMTPESFTKRLGGFFNEGEAQVSCSFMNAAEPGFIHDAYEEAAECCTDYIYIENQYFRYAPFARIFKNHALKIGRTQEDPLYYFVVSNLPEGVATGTSYEMLEELGHEGQMRGEEYRRYLRVKTERDRLAGSKAHLAGRPGMEEVLKSMDERMEALDKKLEELKRKNPGIENGALPAKKVENAEDAFTIKDEGGIKGHIATMVVCAPERQLVYYGHPMEEPTHKNTGKFVYTPVNIHSKLMLVDDVFAIIGSANMNRRSMVSDNEIDISTTRPGVASGMRETLFKTLLGGSFQGTWKRMYEKWKDCLDENWRLHFYGKELVGQLFYLYEPEMYPTTPDAD